MDLRGRPPLRSERLSAANRTVIVDDYTTAYIGLGSNTGDRLEHLRAALRGLERDPQVHVRTASPVYETEAHTLGSDEDQPPFLNAVLEVDVRCSPIHLLSLAQEVEEDAGRVREATDRWAPRPLDVDLLVFGERTCDTGRLTLPHPRLSERAFVLRPWADIAPNLHVPPPFDASVRDLLNDCPDQHKIRRTSHDLIPSEGRGAMKPENDG